MRTALVAAMALALAGGYPAGAKDAAFKEDVEFLKKHTEIIVLSDPSGNGKVVVTPKLQGRIMTSTAGGDEGLSYGWINRELIASGKTQEHINVYGGEDRFWLGPEGGQFSVFFAKGAPFDLAHWFTPAPFDTEPFDLVSQARDRVAPEKEMRLTNYSGTTFQVSVRRLIRLLRPHEVWKALGVAAVPGVKMVAFQSDNWITNKGTQPWTRQTGLLSIWILGMFNPSPSTTVVIPFQTGPDATLGRVVNDRYFGKVPEDRLVVKDGVLYFSADGKHRGKIGLNNNRAKPLLGSYDAKNRVLTLVQYTLPKGKVPYVNSMWEIQKDPFAGDAVNSYNDGPPAPGAKPLGPFYELETSSRAAMLTPGRVLEHLHRTIHFEGSEGDLDKIARATLGVSLGEIKGALK